MSQPKGKNIKSSQFTWNQNIVQFQVDSQIPLKYPKYLQSSQSLQTHFLSKRFCINFPKYQSIFNFANNAIRNKIHSQEFNQWC